jgi:hypothetical protein
MEKVELTVLELYLHRNQLGGFNGLKGFINESGLTEGIKRRANKALKIVLSEIEPINKQLEETRKEKGENSEQEQELLKDTVSIQVEKLDFNMIQNVALEGNYQLLYDKIFINAE